MDLQRFTTEYYEGEDRLQLIGETAEGATVRIWLTRRLLERLLPVLVHWLDAQSADLPHSDVMQGFAQQAARAELTPQPPVRASTDSSAWLATRIDLGTTPERLTLTLHADDAQHAQARLSMPVKLLRQWLLILHALTLKAAWSLDVWPEWMAESSESESRERGLLH